MLLCMKIKRYYKKHPELAQRQRRKRRNVPVLSILSALMSVITDNYTVLKLSKHDTGLTRACLDTLDESVWYIEDNEGEEWSKIADVRVAWGGHDAVDAISKLQRRWDCQDVVFGPKLSLALVDRDHKTCAVARAIAKAVSSKASSVSAA